MSKKVSIIVPVYNGEKYVSRAIDSLLAQSNVNIETFEIICINDGSKDKSGSILNEYHKKYPDIIKPISQDNIGVALTRNKGIKMATGKYVAFLDQDDFYEPDAFFKMLNEIESGDYDVVQCGYRRTNNEHKSIFEVKMKRTKYSRYMVSAAWGKLHKRSFLLENDIQFFDNQYGEDIIFTLREIFSTEKFQIIPNYVAYNWFFNSKSVSNTSQLGFKQNDGFPRLIEEMLRQEAPGSQRSMYEYYILRTVFYYLLKSGRSVKREAFIAREKELLGKIIEHIPSILNNRNILFSPWAELFPMKSMILLMVVVRKLRAVSLFAYLYCRPAR